MKRKIDDVDGKVASAAEKTRQSILKEIAEEQREICKDHKAEQQARLQQQKAMNKRIEKIEELLTSMVQKDAKK